MASSRAGLVLVLAALLVLIGGALWWLADAPPASDGPGATIGPDPEPSAAAPALPRLPDDGGQPIPVSVRQDPPRRADVTARGRRADERVIVVGRLVAPPGIPPPDVEVVLYDAEGVDVAYASPDAEGAFELIDAEPLAEGWMVASLPADRRGHEPLPEGAPAFVGPFPAHALADPPHVVELVVPGACALSGRVRDASGAPVEGADVWAFSPHPPWFGALQDASTDVAGAYALSVDALPLRGLLLAAGAPDLQTVVAGPFDLPSGGSLQIDLLLPAPAPVRGHVRAGGGQPVQGATISLHPAWESFAGEGDWTVTDADGGFELDPLDIPLEGAWVGVEGDGEHGPAVAPVGGRDIVLVVGPPQRLVGRILDAVTGQPVPGGLVRSCLPVPLDGGVDARIALEDDATWDEIEADDQGRFDLRVAVAPPELAVLVVKAGGYSELRVPFAAAARATVGAGVTYEAELRLTSP